MFGKQVQPRGRRQRARLSTCECLEQRGLLSTLTGTQAPVGSPAAEVQASTTPGSFTPIFGSKGLSGWKIPYDWGTAVNHHGVIILNGTKKFFLVSPRQYSNFIMRGEALIPTIGNSGIQFRSHFRHNFLWGYQMELSPPSGNLSGGLWYEGRNWLGYPIRPNLARPNRWNSFEISAVGKDVTFVINGVTALHYTRATESTGYLALQDHGWGGAYRFRNLELEDLSAGS
jgi:hypothetical protein